MIEDCLKHLKTKLFYKTIHQFVMLDKMTKRLDNNVANLQDMYSNLLEYFSNMCSQSWTCIIKWLYVIRVLLTKYQQYCISDKEQSKNGDIQIWYLRKRVHKLQDMSKYRGMCSYISKVFLL